MKQEFLEYSSLPRRVIASVIDGIVLALPLLPWLLSQTEKISYSSVFTAFKAPPETDIVALIFLSLAYFLLFMLYVVGCGLKWQATLGKLIMGIRVVSAKTSQPPTLGQWMIRSVVFMVFVYPYPLTLFTGSGNISGLFFLLWAFFNPFRQTLYDLLAGTMVLRSEPKSKTSHIAAS